MREQGFDSTYLDWCINYACRDDYGALARDTSAWAGAHYFRLSPPGRKGADHLARRQRLDHQEAAHQPRPVRHTGSMVIPFLMLGDVYASAPANASISLGWSSSPLPLFSPRTSSRGSRRCTISCIPRG